MCRLKIEGQTFNDLNITEILLFLQICRRFKISWNSDELGILSLLINKPNGPLKFSFDEILDADSAQSPSRSET